MQINSLFYRLSYVLVFVFFGCAQLPNVVSHVSQLGGEACEVGIVGGGPAGVYLAYKLAPDFGDRICLFEKEDELGGRMRDESVENLGHKIFLGTGARRVNEAQVMVRELGRELGIVFEVPEKRSQLIQHRGTLVYNSDSLVSLYPRMLGELDGNSETSREDELYAYFLEEKNKSMAARYPSLRKFIERLAGVDAPKFLRAASRFHGDFDYDISTSNYLDYLREESKLSAVNLYPVGGMSGFVRIMAERARLQGVRFFLGEPVFEIFESGREYSLRTSKRSLSVKRLVIAVPPVGLEKINGDTAIKLKKAREFRALLPIRIVVINQVWSQPWWERLRDKHVPGDEGRIWRAWSSDQCVNHVEFPQEEYAKKVLVSRSVYTDDPKCVDHWTTLREKHGIAGVQREVLIGLERLFGSLLERKIPDPVNTTMQSWPGGWYYVRAGSGVSNQQIIDWALAPLGRDQNVMLIGEAYWPHRPGWSEGAYLSVNNLLRANFTDRNNSNKRRIDSDLPH